MTKHNHLLKPITDTSRSDINAVYMDETKSFAFECVTCDEIVYLTSDEINTGENEAFCL